MPARPSPTLVKPLEFLFGQFDQELAAAPVGRSSSRTDAASGDRATLAIEYKTSSTRFSNPILRFTDASPKPLGMILSRTLGYIGNMLFLALRESIKLSSLHPQCACAFLAAAQGHSHRDSESRSPGGATLLLCRSWKKHTKT